MSEILKTKAICLKKVDFGDTSKIATLFTPNYGKISVIIKSGRNKNSKIGAIVDVFNLIEIVYYNKSSREIQLLTQAELLNFYSNIKSDLEKLKYASAILELYNELVHEGEVNNKLFAGLERILQLIESSSESPKVLFIKFLFFFIKEIGYEIEQNRCSECGSIIKNDEGFFDSQKGIICNECYKDTETPYEISKELFNFIISLSNKNKANFAKNLDLIIFYLLRYLKQNITEFKGLISLMIY